MSMLSNQCRRKAEEKGYAALMNDTKWRELCFAFSAFEKKPTWRARDFLNGHLSSSDPEWFHHLGPDYCMIEWLEINPRDCDRELIREALNIVGIQFEEEEYFKIFGYKK